MHSLLRTPLTLFCSAPLALLAQLTAGDLDNVLHTDVDHELHPAPVTFPGESLDSVSVDLDGDGVLDLYFQSGLTKYIDAINNYTVVSMLQPGVAFAVSGTNGHAARRLDAGTPIDAGFTWREFSTDEFPNNTAYIGNQGVSIGGGFTLGGDEWLANGPVDTEGYLAVRITHGAQVRYGWIDLVSHIEYDTVWLRINDMAIEDEATAVDEVPALDRITVCPTPDGTILLQGPLNEVQRITMHDAGGRMVRQLSGPVPSVIDLSDGPHGVYVLCLVGRAGVRPIKVAW